MAAAGAEVLDHNDAEDATVSQGHDVTATLNYVDPKIVGDARFDVFNMENSNIAWVPYEVPIYDARPIRDSLRIEETGFAFVRHHSSVDMECLYDENIKYQHVPVGISAKYEQEVCDYLKEMTGAREVFRQLGGLLARTSLRGTKQTWAYPAPFVHLDFTASAALQFIDWTLASEGRQLAPFRRHAIFQTWRAISPGPQDSTLAICDGSSVPISDGIVVDSIIGPVDVPGNRFDSRMAHYSPAHRWYYLSNMEPDDLLIFKGFDSEMPDVMNAMHTAFENPLGQEGEPRRSIESRFIAIYD